MSFGLCDALNTVFYLLPNYHFRKYSLLTWTILSKVFLLFWFIIYYDNRIKSVLATFILTTAAMVMLGYAMERAINDRYAHEQDKVGSIDLYISLYLDVPHLIGSTLWKYRSKNTVISNKYEIHATKKTN